MVSVFFVFDCDKEEKGKNENIGVTVQSCSICTVKLDSNMKGERV